MQRVAVISDASSDASLYFVNVDFTAGGATGTVGAICDAYGGILGSPGNADEIIMAYLGNDVICSINVYIRGGTVSLAYVAAGQKIGAVLGSVGVVAQSGTGPFVWGPGSLDVQGASLQYPSGGATAMLIQGGGTTINAQGTAFSATVAQPSVINASVPITGPHLDAAAGTAGFGGAAWLPGGASIVDYGF